jgi:prolyl-tRNA editing enzyme YbaK/EbsC (Cys-tRNA(Pro) deacylase)
VDEAVFAPAEISIGSGERGTTIILTRQAILDALEAVEIGLFATQEQSPG